MSDGERALEVPPIRLEMIEDLTPDTGNGFMRLVRRKLRAHYPDGTVSAPFVYDEADRNAIDAVVVVPHFVTLSGERRVYLRSSVRPAIYFRSRSRDPIPLPDRKGSLWEVPAGLIEADEQTPDGLRNAAARELLEETGFDVPADALEMLGPATFPSPGIISERHFFFAAHVDPEKKQEPSLDGSALEKFGAVVDVSLDRALAWCRQGELDDAKTELALRRLRERYP
jgi:ADP-ribose pyrophosphatase